MKHQLVNPPYAPVDNWVLVLLDGTERDILGIWGPYPSEAHAELAEQELRKWPIDGIWEPVALKHFPAPAATTGPLQPGISWTNSWPHDWGTDWGTLRNG